MTKHRKILQIEFDLVQDSYKPSDVKKIINKTIKYTKEGIKIKVNLIKEK